MTDTKPVTCDALNLKPTPNEKYKETKTQTGWSTFSVHSSPVVTGKVLVHSALRIFVKYSTFCIPA